MCGFALNNKKLSTRFNLFLSMGLLLLSVSVVIMGPDRFQSSGFSNAASIIFLRQCEVLRECIGAIAQLRSIAQSTQSVRDWYKVALAYSKAGGYGLAAQALESIVRTEPADPIVLKLYGDALYGQGFQEPAYAAWRRAGLNGDYFIKVGNAYLVQGKYPEARQTAEIARHLGNIDGSAYVVEAMALLGEGDVRAGLKNYHMALALNSQAATLQTHVAFAEALSAAGHWREALELWEWAIKDGQWGWIPYFYHGQLLVAHGDLATALVDFEKAIVRGGEGAWVYFHLGLTYAAMGDFASAIQPYHRAISQAPSVPLFHLELARAYEALGRKTEAEQERQIVRQLMSGGTSGTQTRP